MISPIVHFATLTTSPCSASLCMEEKMQVMPVLLGVGAGHENVVDVQKEESPTDLVHKSLECLCCVLEAEGHAEELE